MSSAYKSFTGNVYYVSVLNLGSSRHNFYTISNMLYTSSFPPFPANTHHVLICYTRCILHMLVTCSFFLLVNSNTDFVEVPRLW